MTDRDDDPGTTARLLGEARSGSAPALQKLLDRYRLPLNRWANGRLPAHARDVFDTEDLVQEALIQSISKIDDFQLRWKGSFHSYLRQAVLNRIRDQVRRAQVRERAYDQAGPLVAAETSPLEHAIGVDALERYEAALQRLDEEDRELIVARMEMDVSYEELAAIMGRPSADAVRMAVKRALTRLAREMDR